ncbi:hypothetical protein HK414_06540 [Ramlibacter terrae]|uniref:Uncharacterized protein n=1 Tax=Ramlibacter terrae TaxID=2732511 RepID=A0ABX6P154_9BURK|nr:hypothetical protein HK414_06540 [Ramlibacter terrae]
MQDTPPRKLPRSPEHWLLGSAASFAAAPHLFPAQAAARRAASPDSAC